MSADLARAKPALPSGVSASAVAGAIVAAKSVDQALADAVELGALAAEEIPEDPTDRLFTLKRLWDGVALSQPDARLGIDPGWAVPAIKVEGGGKSYLVHPVAHGQIFAPNARGVRKLVEEIRASGARLLSEQGLPLHYGYNEGQETLDHAVDEGLPLAVAAAAQGAPLYAVSAARWVKNGFAAALIAGSTAFAVSDPNWLSLGGFALALGALWLALQGFLPYYRWKDLRRARWFEKIGSPEAAEQLRREAAAFHRPLVDPAEVLKLTLPPGPGAAHDSYSPRSMAMAAAALGLSAKVVHLIVGHGHAAEIAWRLVAALPATGTKTQDQDPAFVGQKKTEPHPGGLI